MIRGYGRRSVAIHFSTAAIALSSRSTVPIGGICDDGRRERIRTSIALAPGSVGLILWPRARGRFALELTCDLTLSVRP